MNLGLAPRAAQVLNRSGEPKNSVNSSDRLDLTDPHGKKHHPKGSATFRSFSHNPTVETLIAIYNNSDPWSD